MRRTAPRSPASSEPTTSCVTARRMSAHANLAMFAELARGLAGDRGLGHGEELDQLARLHVPVVGVDDPYLNQREVGVGRPARKPGLGDLVPELLLLARVLDQRRGA